MTGAGEMADETDETRYSPEKHEATEQAMRGITLRELRELSEVEIVRRYDLLMDPYTGSGWLGPDDYRAELDRRVTERQTTWLVRLTWIIAVLTVVLVALELLPRILGAEH
jgi:hypothetical protein